MYRFETHMTGFEATTQHSRKDKCSRASCYAYPVCLTLLAGNQTNMLYINSTSAHDIMLLPLRQRHLHSPCCCSSSVTHCPVVTMLEPTTGYTFLVLCTEGKRKLKTERRNGFQTKRLVGDEAPCYISATQSTDSFQL